MNNLELIQELLQQAEEVAYRNGKLDAVIKRGEMLIRKIFGDSTHYLKSWKSIEFSPRIWTTGTPDSYFENSFNRGKKELLNLLTVIAEDIQLDSTINSKSSSNKITNSNNVFVVHGHNEEMKQAVARILEKLGLTPVILHEQPSKGNTIIEKFTENSDVSFAVVLLSTDDIAYCRKEKPEKAKFRARQNVIFELGYFIGKIGRDRVLALHEIADEFEIPSDYKGVAFVPFDKNGKWQFDLVKELRAVGISVDANRLV